MNIFQAIFLGLVQGLTEFLPVSSSGHLVLFEELLGLTGSDISFELLLHFSTLLAIIVFFFKDIINLRKQEIIAIVSGTLPVVLVGLFLKNYVDLIFSWPILVSFALFVTGLINFFIDKSVENEAETKSDKDLNFKSGFIVGLFQAFAIIPGISRSGSTVLGGLSQSLDRRSAFRFSFLLAIPAILGASVLQISDLLETGFSQIQIVPYLLGGLSAFVFSLASLYLFKYVIDKARFEFFAYYCFAVSIISLFFLI